MHNFHINITNTQKNMIIMLSHSYVCLFLDPYPDGVQYFKPFDFAMP